MADVSATVSNTASSVRWLSSRTERLRAGAGCWRAWRARSAAFLLLVSTDALLPAVSERAADCAQLLDPPALQQVAARLSHHLGPRPTTAAPLPEAHSRRGPRDRWDFAGAALGEADTGQVLPRRGHQPIRAPHPRREDRLCRLDLEHGGGAARARHTAPPQTGRTAHRRGDAHAHSLHMALHVRCVRHCS